MPVESVEETTSCITTVPVKTLPTTATTTATIEEPEMKRFKADECQMNYQRPILKFMKITENGFAPTRASKDAAGYDLYRFNFWNLNLEK
jgi:hypothetical protein